MPIITDSKELKKRLKAFEKEPFIAIDTEFVREKTYYPQLCLIQVAGRNDAFAIDALEDIDLKPFFDLLANKNVVKVFHAPEQDIEILYYLTGKVPSPLFDTQVAAEVLGYGESIGYGNLVQMLSGVELDKSSRFTDWARRPLSEAQLTYALSDVTYLRDIAEKLLTQLAAKDRLQWFEEEMAYLTTPERYHVIPEEAWKKLKVRGGNAEFFGVLRQVAAWRERRAQEKDVPRRWVMRDETMLEIAAARPKTIKQLEDLRLNVSTTRKEEKMQAIVDAVLKGLEDPVNDLPKKKRESEKNTALLELLKILLRMQSEAHDVGKSVIASDDDLHKIAGLPKGQVDTDIPALHGWRWEMFGKAAIALKNGEIAISASGKKTVMIELNKA